MTGLSEASRAAAHLLRAVWVRPWLGFAAVFAYALWQRWNMPWLPLATADTWGFLAPALCELAGEGFPQTNGRSFAYPLFLLLVLRATESFSAIAVAQHVLGLLSGVVWIWVFSLWVAWLPPAVRQRPWVWWLGAFALGQFLLGARTVVFETLLRPESIFPFLAFIQLGCTLAFIRTRWTPARSTWVVVAGATAVLGGVLCSSLKPSWGFAALIPPLVLLAGIVASGKPTKRLVSLVALVFGVGLVSFWQRGIPYATGWIADNQAKTFLPATLFTVHAGLVSQAMHEKSALGLLNADEIDFLKNLDRRLSESRDVVPRVYNLLPHDPDYLMYRSDALAELPVGANATTELRTEYLWSAYFEAWKTQPAGMMNKVWRQLIHAFSDAHQTLYRPAVPWRRNFESARTLMAQYRPPALTPELAADWDKLTDKCSALAYTEPERRRFAPDFPVWFHGFVLVVVLALLVVLGLLVFPAGRWIFPSQGDLLPSARVFGVIVVTHLGTVLTVALVHSFDIGRYMALLSPSQSLILATGSVLVAALLSAAYCDRSVRNTNYCAEV